MSAPKYRTETKKFSELKGVIEVPKFQRGLVWGKEKKREFINTLKAGLPIGVLLLSEKGKHFLVIDGLQRFTTMMEYSRDYFSYISRDEIADTDIMSIVLASPTASNFYNLFDEENKKRIRESIRDEIAYSISHGHNQNNYIISKNASEAICKKLAEFPAEDETAIMQYVYTIVDQVSKSANIDDVEIPVIIFFGNEDELATIFQKLNQEGVKLSKYDVFAATWINQTITIHNDPSFIDLIIKKYDAARGESRLEIANYDPDVMKATGQLTVFEYAFAIGKAILNACSRLYPNKKDDSSIDSIGFLILAELMGLKYMEMGQLAKRIGEMKNVDYKQLKDAIVESAKFVESALGTYIVSPTSKKTSLVCHSELQLASYIIVVFKLKYSLSADKGLIPNSKSKLLKEVKAYLYKHYIYDILRGFWSGSGNTKLEEIIAAPETCRYVKDVDKSSFEQAVQDWLAQANKKVAQINVTAETKLFLNYLLRGRVPDVDKGTYDIEHCAPKKVLQDYLIKKGSVVPISSVCNLVYIPLPDNRSKGELTYYQKQAKDSKTYSLNAGELDRLVYPAKSDLSFVESVATITADNYMRYLKDRETIILKAFITGLYKA